MTCPVCGGKLAVMDSRTDCECVYRRRKCEDCGQSVYTEEYESPSAKTLLNQVAKRKLLITKGVQHGKASQDYSN